MTGTVQSEHEPWPSHHWWAGLKATLEILLGFESSWLTSRWGSSPVVATQFEATRRAKHLDTTTKPLNIRRPQTHRLRPTNQWAFCFFFFLCRTSSATTLSRRSTSWPCCILGAVVATVSLQISYSWNTPGLDENLYMWYHIYSDYIPLMTYTF